MELKSLYRVRFVYPESWSVKLAGADSNESQWFMLAEGHCEGRITGKFRGANHPLRRGVGTFQPNFQGVIELDDGAVIYFDYRGYGRANPRSIVGTATHLTEDERFKWLNDNVCVGVGEFRSRPDQSTELVIDWFELIWQPLDS